MTQSRDAIESEAHLPVEMAAATTRRTTLLEDRGACQISTAGETEMIGTETIEDMMNVISDDTTRNHGVKDGIDKTSEMHPKEDLVERVWIGKAKTTAVSSTRDAVV